MHWSEFVSKEIVTLSNQLYQKAILEQQAGKTICPPPEQIFRALNLTSPENTKCVIVGQDPYHTPGQANGLAFSVNNGTQPSLTNIFKELSSDLGIPIPATGDLTPWAKQGVLLLNTSLTTEAHIAAAHKDWGWYKVTQAILTAAMALPQPIIFLVWGRHAQDAIRGIIRGENKEILASSHPSPFSAAKGTSRAPAFFGSRPFSKVNEFLVAHGQTPIDWTL